MYFAKAELNRRRRGAVRLLSDPQRMHAATMSCFGVEDPGRVLWRVDSGSHVDTLYVVAPERPDLTHIVEDAGWPEAHPAQVREYAPLLDRLAPGMEVGYRFTGNPTKVKTFGGAKKRIALSAPDQVEWAQRVLTEAGLETVPDLESRETTRFTKDKSERQVVLSRATFMGSGVITDPGLLRRALTDGIGRGKAYGCGLLTLG